MPLLDTLYHVYTASWNVLPLTLKTGKVWTCLDADVFVIRSKWCVCITCAPPAIRSPPRKGQNPGWINVPYKAPLAPEPPNHLAINKVTTAGSQFSTSCKGGETPGVNKWPKSTYLTKTVAWISPFVELEADGVVDARTEAFHFS